MIVKTTKDDISNWIGNDNLTIDKLLELYIMLKVLCFIIAIIKSNNSFHFDKFNV
jgi:hypothetical protein